MMNYDELVRNRYSVRAFRQDPVSTADMLAILEAGRLCPTAKNQQPQRIYAVRDKALLAKINEKVRCAYHAPLLLVVCAEEASAWQNPYTGQSSAVIDGTISAVHMMLKAQDLGLGSCYVCWYDPAVIAELLHLPQTLTPCCLLPVGYPAEEATPSENHTKRFPPEQTVTIIG